MKANADIKGAMQKLTDAQPDLLHFVSGALVASLDDVWDVVQDTNYALISHIEDYQPDKPFLPWALKIAKNKVIDFQRKRARDRLVFDEKLLDLYARAPAATAGSEEAYANRVKRLQACLDKLTPAQRALVDLHYFKNRALVQIAREQKKTESAIRVTAFRIRQALYACMHRACPMQPGRGEASDSVPDDKTFEDLLPQVLDEPRPDPVQTRRLFALLRKSPARMDAYAEQAAVHFMLREQAECAASKPARRVPWLRLAAGLALLLAGLGWAGTELLSPAPRTPQSPISPDSADSYSRAGWASAPTPAPKPAPFVTPVSVVTTNTQKGDTETMNAVTQTVLAATAAALTLTAPSVGSADDTLGLWLFNGPVQTAVTSVSNAVNAAAYPGTYHADEATNPAVYSDDIPGRYLYSGLTNTVPLAELATSIRFFANNIQNDSRSGRLTLADICSALSTNEAYTIECFFKADLPQNANWRTIFKGSYRDTNWKISANPGIYDDLTLQIESSTAYYESFGIANGWHHLAFVYTGSNHLAKIYVDYIDKNASLPMTNAILPDSQALIFGSASSTGSTEGWNGWVAAPRVTARALAPSDFLCVATMPAKTASDPIAFWPFLESGPYTEFATTFNALDPIRYRGVAQTSSGLPLVFSPDVPAPYLYADATASEPFCDSFQSVYFEKMDPNTWTSPSSRLDMLSAESAMAASESCTLEFFCKQDVSKGWSAWDNVACGGTGDSDNQHWNIAVNSDNSMCLQRDQNVTSATFSTGAWHHVALVYSATNHTAQFYVDYVSAPNNVTLTNDAVGANTKLAFGSSQINSSYESWNGWVAAPRLTPRALAPSEFMQARKVAARPVTVLHWRFEDGAIGSDVTTATNSSAGKDFYNFTEGKGRSGTYGGVKPVYAAFNPSTLLLYSGDTLIGLNTHCATFTGATSADKPWATSILSATEGSDGWKIVTNFTAECFARMTSGAVWGIPLLMGQCNAESGGYDWMLSCDSDGSLQIHAQTSGEAPSLSQPSPRALADKQWHHVAVTYAGSNQTLRVYTDYKLAAETSLGSPLTRNNYNLNFGRGENYVGFNGQMDEIRFTAATLQPADFLRLKAPPGSSVTLR